MKWMFPKGSQQSDASFTDFNSSLPENDGDGVVCLAEREPGKNEADVDIREGRVEQFDDLDEMIESLKRPS